MISPGLFIGQLCSVVPRCDNVQLRVTTRCRAFGVSSALAAVQLDEVEKGAPIYSIDWGSNWVYKIRDAYGQGFAGSIIFFLFSIFFFFPFSLSHCPQPGTAYESAISCGMRGKWDAPKLDCMSNSILISQGMVIGLTARYANVGNSSCIRSSKEVC
ncbi:hypothetical protein GGR58DRAFT_250260 [Xylaria digitata]|nr:hypothetical protein GGR58DRAFT_250260 [Xylaria digitata]